MPTEHAVAPVISSRRFACDRCRVQKAKCIREHPDQARCDRCTRADLECVTSPECRVQNWQIISQEDVSLSARGDSTRKRRRRGHQHQQLLTPSETNGALRASFLSNISHGTSLSSSDQSNNWPSLGYTLATQPLSGSSAQNAGDGDTAQFEAMFTEAADSSMEFMHSGLGLSHDFFTTATLPPAQAGLYVSSAPANPNATRPGSPRVGGPSPSQPTPTSGADQSVSVGGGGGSSNSYTRDAEHPLQQLSRVDYDLITLLTYLAKGRPHVTIDTMISPIDGAKSSTPAVDDILNRTREFIDVLKLLSEYQSPSQPAPAQTRQESWKRRPTQSSVGYASSDSDNGIGLDSPTDYVSSTIPSLPATSNLSTVPTLDSASLLAILSIYIRVLRLHLVIFAHIHDLLTGILESDDPILCPIPGLNFSSFPIREY